MTEIQITNLADATIRIQTAEKNIRDNWVDMANTLIQVRDEKLWEEGDTPASSSTSTKSWGMASSGSTS